MYFEAQNDWEIDSSIFSVFGGPKKRRFPLIELSMNLSILLVDAEIEYEDEDAAVFVHRFMFGSVHDALKFISQPTIKESKISLLSRRCDNEGDYGVSDLVEIIQAKDEADQLAHIFCVKNGKKYIDSALASSEDELKEFETIYFKSL